MHNRVIPPEVSASMASGYSTSTGERGRSSSSAAFARQNGLNLAMPPPPPPPSSPPPPMQSTTASYAAPAPVSMRSASPRIRSSAADVSIKTRKTALHPTAELSKCVDELLRRVHGSPTPLLQRRTMVTIADSPASETPVDPLAVLEKIKRRIQADAEQYLDQPHVMISSLHEHYSRFVKLPGFNKKGETLLLFYRLMNSVQPQYLARNQAFNGSSTSGPVPMELEDSAPARHPFSSDGTSSQFARTKPTELDALEDSFKFAVGITAPKSARAKSGMRSPSKNVRDSSTAFGSFEVTEEVLLRDVLYALQAIDSRYIYFDKAADRFQITRSAGVPTPMREMIHKLCELGWFYRKISEFLKHYREDLSYGVVGQSFCHALNLELSDYYRLVAVLASQVDDDAESNKSDRRSVSDLTLRKLLVWVHDPLEKMRIITRLIDSVDGLRGGALASGIHTHLLHGDPSIRQYVQSVMKAVAAPIFRMIRRWVFEGELDDTHGEFFVVANQKVPDDLLWSQKYQLHLDMLPAFISMDLAKKILVIGKSINFIRQCCGNSDWIVDAKHNASVGATVEFEDNGVRFAQLSNLEAMIAHVSFTTNEYLIRTLMEKYELLDHCRALRRYMLLGQGDFIQYLMDLLRPELSKRASHVHRHTLMNVLETALNASNAKFESGDILARLDVELLRPSSGDSGWDIFSLHYRVPSPVNTVINDAAILEYQRIFHFLWRLKRVEHSLSTSWNKDMHLDHMIKRDFVEFRPLIHRCQLLRSEMIQFTTTLHNYVMFEVLETSWHKLVKDLKAAKDLDELISSHEDYLSTIREKGFMNESTRDLLNQLKVIFDTILKFCRAQDNLYTSAIREVDSEATRRKTIEKRTAQGTWGIAEGDEQAEQARKETFGPGSLIYRQITDINKDFTTQVGSLLQMLATRTGSSLQSLSSLMIRFDFNEYYQNLLAPKSAEE
ncbi:hypothetical protein Poli38472_002571 [Pythium oligandrum]|uniref:Spindle pole body component n=1 Tax=Pythium oligandrum TaxID=41045 RepID=A0A8K1FH84_PYTOL|nr:hypothetical protein Poli38472_002571 [Pythium oligandrum]|eukprot:TMW63630.1 hypothetical protein Poli38472_002571 [Pythium oligandrum]